uniref:Protein kinase domain-containing protein n=1 Tax=Rhodosorus marinus TaxID=101924 RepID=A0A7S0BP77_9RHOD|mmetsp:Transcript_3054/g.4371  ORF Transcript_3054/g.4371 Transcript_3054/m.4371 type:complete len:419 (+) Transcript_3054:230-1486(+)
MSVGSSDRGCAAKREGWAWIRKGLFGWERVRLQLEKSRLSVVDGEHKEIWSVETARCKFFQGWENEIVVKDANRTMLFRLERDGQDFVAWWRAMEAAMCPKLRNYFHAEELIGEGQTALVKAAWSKANGGNVALKMMSRSSGSHADHVLKQFLNEVRLTYAAQSDHVVRIIDAFATETDYVLVLEKGTRTLLNLLEERVVLTEREARKVMGQLLATTAELHKRGITHRDLKLDNILCREGEDDYMLLADFGSAAFGMADPAEVKTDIFTAHVGTPAYLAPECWKEKRYGSQVDAFALGVIMYALLSRTFPFPIGGCWENGSFIEPDFTSDVWSSVSSSAKSLIRGLLREDPRKRLSSVAALQHFWFSEEDGGTLDGDLTCRGRSLPPKNQNNSPTRPFKTVALAQLAVATFGLSANSF